MPTSTLFKPIAIVAGVLLLAGCSVQAAPNATSGSSPAATPATPTTAASTCVTDPAAVIAAPATPESTTAALPADLASTLDAAAASSFALAAAPGAIVGVRTPQGTWTAAYGSADPATNTPMAVGMNTRIASLTKMYAGSILLQLAEQGSLSLDDTIGKYITGIPNGDQITLRQLADMTSGIASYTASEPFTDGYFANPEAVYTPDQVVAVGVSLSPLFAPGESFAYSNTNTVLLGQVIEKVTGKPFGEVLQENILTPLKLTSTTWPGDSNAIPEPYAHGFTLNGPAATPSAPTDSTNWNPSWAYTSGEIISNVTDLLTMGRALGTGQGLLDPAAQTERLTSFSPDTGYGIAMGCRDGWVGHSGELSGYNTTLFYDTTSDTTVVVQTNSDIASGDCSVSPTLSDNPSEQVCAAPAVRMFAALSTALGHPYTPPPAR
ncbi:serine hydrolase domain-containing protein [Subtercola sp. YIM 133946]|uniref:serine hydrolase domain-containing protein n=1 Tax=Subtercola sp. YIM 133946 TaxID=3118909 RepID=UPI002F9592F1